MAGATAPGAAQARRLGPSCSSPGPRRLTTVVEPYWLGSPSTPLFRPKSEPTTRYFDYRSKRAVQARSATPSTPLGATPEVDCSRQPSISSPPEHARQDSFEPPPCRARETAARSDIATWHAKARELAPEGADSKPRGAARQRRLAANRSSPTAGVTPGDRAACREPKPTTDHTQDPVASDRNRPRRSPATSRHATANRGEPKR